MDRWHPDAGVHPQASIGPVRTSHGSALNHPAGWLSIDANQHGNANRYLSATLYAAHEIDDLGLAAHALGYMSLHAFYRGKPRKALSLANTAIDLAKAEATPRTLAILHNRAARAYARLGDTDACRKNLDLARAAYVRGQHPDGDPRWIEYVDGVEIAAQRGACMLDMDRPDEAVAALREAINLVHSTAPDHLRDLAHYKIRLASAHLLQDAPEQAVLVASEAYDLAQRIGSARVTERFEELVSQMDAYDTPETRAFVERVRYP